MARDAIGIMGIDMEDDQKELPVPSRPEDVKHEAGLNVSAVLQTALKQELKL
jgi:post-segregation antitoxin (ccd killing protein)